jgi:hypothetical protein
MRVSLGGNLGWRGQRTALTVVGKPHTCVAETGNPPVIARRFDAGRTLVILNNVMM